MKKILFLILLIFNCTLTKEQSRSIQTFAHTSQIFGKELEEEIIYLRNKTIDLNKKRLILETKLNTNREKALNIEGAFEAKTIKLRLLAIDVLLRYANLLLSLNSNDDEIEFKNNLKELGVSIQEFKGDKSKNPYLELIQEISVGIIQTKKKEITKKVLLKSKETVQALIDLLENDFDPEKGKFSLSFKLQCKNHLVFSESELAGKSIKDKIKSELISLQTESELNEKRRLEIHSELMQSLKLFRETNLKLIDSFENEKYSLEELIYFSNQIKKLKQYKSIF
jgi:hypothetical protein